MKKRTRLLHALIGFHLEQNGPGPLKSNTETVCAALSNKIIKSKINEKRKNKVEAHQTTIQEFNGCIQPKGWRNDTGEIYRGGAS